MARTVVKFYCDDGEIFRRQLPEPTFEAIVELVTNFRLDVKAHMLHEGRACALKYADDEGDQCVLTPSTFSDFLALQTVDQPLKLQLKLPSTKEGLDHQRLNAEDTNLGDGHPMLPSTPWRPSGSVAPGGGLQQFLHSLCTLQESGSVTAETLASLLVAWIPSLAQIAERRSEQIRDMAKNGPNPTLQKMLEIIQEQAASTPGLEHFAAVIAKVLGGEIDQRRLGKALPNMMKALQKLEVEVQSRFCEGVAHPLLPYVKELTKLSIGCIYGGKNKGKGKGKEQGKQLKRIKMDYGANANHQPFSEGGGLRKFLLVLRGLQESGSVTAETLASLLVAWIPSLAQIAERRSEQIRDMAKNGPNPTLQKMLEIIQEQAASTPGLEHFAAVIAKVLGGEIDQRRLGKALPNMMKALQKLEVEVQSRFCEGVAHPLLPHVKELSKLSIACHEGGKRKGESGESEGKSAKRSKLEDGATHQPFSEGGGLRKFLLGLRGLQESGSVTAETLASLLVAWIPSLAQIAERRSEQIRDMAKNGPNPTLQKMLEIIQEQAASTPGLEHFAAVIAKVLGGEIDQRRLGKALPNMMKALQKLEVEVQTRFCEGVAHPLLPHVEELSRLSFGHNEGKSKGKGGKGKAASA